MRRWLDLLRNPFFRHEWSRRRRYAWAASLAGLNLAYLVLFALALFRQPLAHGRGIMAFAAQFNFSPWLLAGALLLSLCGHWLVPYLVLAVMCRNYELRTVALLVREKRPEDEVLRGQVAAGVGPLVLGAAPLVVLGCPLLAGFALHVVPLAAAAIAAAGLWGWLGTSVSFWSACRWRRPLRAALESYGLTCIALPLGIGLISVGLALGCSAGRHGRDHESTFLFAGVLTWSILVAGLAATFWDLSLRRLFPDRCQPLWQEATVPERLEP